MESFVNGFCLLGVDDKDWLKKLSSSSVLKPALGVPLKAWVETLDKSSVEAVRKLENKSESDAVFLPGVSFVGVSTTNTKLAASKNTS